MCKSFCYIDGLWLVHGKRGAKKDEPFSQSTHRSKPVTSHMLESQTPGDRCTPASQEEVTRPHACSGKNPTNRLIPPPHYYPRNRPRTSSQIFRNVGPTKQGETKQSRLPTNHHHHPFLLHCRALTCDATTQSARVMANNAADLESWLPNRGAEESAESNICTTTPRAGLV